MFIPHIEHITEPALAVDLGSSSMRAIAYIPGALPQDQAIFQLPSPEHVLAERIRSNSAMRRGIFVHGKNLGRVAASALHKHLHMGLPLNIHPNYAALLTHNPEKLTKMGIEISPIAPLQAVSVEATEFDAGFWNALMDMTELPQPETLLVCALEKGAPFDETDERPLALWLHRLFAESGGGGIPLAELFPAQAAPEMLRLSSIQRITGFPVADSAIAFIFGLLSIPLVAGRSGREGLVLVELSRHTLRAALVYREHLFALLEMPSVVFCGASTPGAEMDLETLEQWLDDLRLGWLPSEKASDRGGFLCRAPALPPEAEGFRPMFVAGPDAPLLEKSGQIAGGAMHSVLNGCWGLLCAYGRYHASR